MRVFLTRLTRFFAIAALCCCATVLFCGCRAAGADDALRANGQLAPMLALDSLLAPSNYRQWKADVGSLPRMSRSGDLVTVANVRDFRYRSDDDFTVRYEDRQYDLSRMRTVDFIVVPFQQAETLAHTMLSFGFAGGEYLGVSVEARLEEGESYSPLKGALRQYELTYVVGDERDLIGRRLAHRHDDVYIYRTVATPEQARELFMDVMQRANKLADNPEFYDTLSNNCTSNITRHINRLRPGIVPLDVRVLLPGLSDRFAFDRGLLQTASLNSLNSSLNSFEDTRRRAYVGTVSAAAIANPDFSQLIRR